VRRTRLSAPENANPARQGYSAAYSVERGVVVGESIAGAGALRALYLTGGAMPLPDPTRESVAMAIKGRYVVGAQLASDGFTHAFLFDGTKALLLPVTGQIQSGDVTATAGNAAGTAVGFGLTTLSVVPCHRPYLWQGGKVKDLLAAYAINDNGIIVGEFSGSTDLGQSRTHAFLCSIKDLNAIVQDLNAGHHPDTFSSARAINRIGTVVGRAQTRGVDYAFVWTARTGLQDLNALMPAGTSWHLTAATGIDEQGNICGVGTLNGQPHAFLLSP
jgi:uncharacterized membrane protein